MTDRALVEVRLIGLPLAIHRRSSEHYDGLLRELALLMGAGRRPTGQVPDLVPLAEELTDRYSGFTAEPDAALELALQTDAQTVDLVYHLPAEVADASARLDELLDEAEEQCRAGFGLLTLAAAPDVLAYRRWFLHEFIDQLRGGPPRPWDTPHTER